jgi:hypothetical protein
LSWNEKTGEKEYKKVTELFVHDVKLLFEVRVQKPLDGSLTSLVDETILETTWNHPFWVVDKKAWVEVKDLKLGNRVILSDGKEVAISGIKSYNVEVTKVYNFEVADNHTYFVGEDGVLVHNYVASAGNPASQSEKLFNSITEFGSKVAEFAIDTYNYAGDGLMKASATALNSITGVLDGYNELWKKSDGWGLSSAGEFGKALGRIATMPLAIPAYGLHVATNMTAMVAGSILQPASIVDYTWGSLGTGAGLALGTAQILAGNKATVENGAVLFKNSNIMDLTLPEKGYINGVSLGPILSGSTGFGEWKHEFGHSQDNRIVGPGYLGIMIASGYSVWKQNDDIKKVNRGELLDKDRHKHKLNWTETSANNPNYQEEWNRRNRPWDWGKR